MERISGKLLIFIAMLMPFIAEAQGLPALPKDPAITSGSLPNGVEYYIVKNQTNPGHADFALVQKGHVDPEASRKALLSLPHLGGRIPYKFLTEHGAKCPQEGFISFRNGSTRFDFRDLAVCEKAVADTTLMMLFDLAATCRGGQAMVVSGDVNPAEITDKMKLFSLLLDARDKVETEDPDGWKMSDSLCVHFSVNQTRNVAAVHMLCSSRRLPKDHLNTAMPMVTRMLAYELGIVLRERFESAFSAARLPLGGMEYRYIDAVSGPGDDRYLVTVYTVADDLPAAARLIASVMSDLDANGATLGEFREVKARMTFSARRALRDNVSTNAGYLEKCVSSYLYGTNLAPEGQIWDFLIKRNLPVEKELDLFNSFAKALLDLNRNLCLRFDIPDVPMDRDAIAKSFVNSWRTRSSLPDIKWGRPLSEDRFLDPKSKLKIRSEAPEPITGGTLLTFTNGMKVIYKNVPSTGEFHYGLLVKGGYPDMSGLENGENRYVSDMLSLYRVGGLSGNEFRRLLANRGVQMNFGVTLSDLRITGSAPSSEFDLVFRSMLTLANDRKMDRDAFSMYAREQELRDDMRRLHPRDVDAVMDSMLFSEYPYLHSHASGRPAGRIQTSSEMFFSQQFSKMTDGVIVLVGDLGEETVRKDLCRLLGAFSTQKRYAQRPVVSKTPASGGRSATDKAALWAVGGRELGSNMELCLPLSFSIASFSSFSIAMDVLERELDRNLVEAGFSVDVRTRIELFPNEQAFVYLHLRPCVPSGLPHGIMPSSSEDALAVVKSVLSSAGTLDIPADMVKAGKTRLLHSYDNLVGNPEELLDAVLVRYSEGRNVVSDYRNAVNSVGESGIRDILKAMESASWADYTIGWDQGLVQ